MHGNFGDQFKSIVAWRILFLRTFSRICVGCISNARLPFRRWVSTRKTRIDRIADIDKPPECMEILSPVVPFFNVNFCGPPSTLTRNSDPLPTEVISILQFRSWGEAAGAAEVVMPLQSPTINWFVQRWFSVNNGKQN